MRPLAEFVVYLLCVPLACGLAGCSSIHSRPRLLALRELELQPATAEDELARATALEAAGDDRCVEAYYLACQLAWQNLVDDPRECSPYNAAVHHLLSTGLRFGRLDLARGLKIHDGGQTTVVPVVQHGFAWQPGDFQRLHPPPSGHEPLLTRRYGCSGIGLPLVVERSRNNCDPIEARFLPEKSFFAATAVLRFDGPAAVLEFHNPVQVRSLATAAGELPLARDLSAPLAQTLDEAPRSYFAGFVEPGGAATSARLSFLEPYQTGKIPVVLIHGLFSDPLSWADMVNDLRAVPGFSERFQLWVFRYPTGQGFLQSAAALRRELRAAVSQFDRTGSDPALHQIVLVGHSMGGLIAKLQVTDAGEIVWSRVANRPLAEIVTTEPTRTLLAELCYFDASPDVARVIFIASPHCGSLRSSACVGQGAALLVEPSPEQAAMHAQLMRENQETFNPLLERRFPTSIDMLAPESPLLDAMRQMQLKPGVKLHNIIGVSHPLSLDGPSDGVVSAKSATHPGCYSVLAVGAPHAKVHRYLETSAEVLRILCQP
jgi:pimeloyl-ACP methyl ester carboxylesterase